MSYGILVVEDEETLAKNIKRYLERASYEVSIASDAEEGLRTFEQMRPDLVLLDLNLPDAPGMTVLDAMRRQDNRVKVIILTAHGDVRTAVDAMKTGAYDYVSKPVALGELKILIDKAIGLERLETTLSYYRAREADMSGLSKILGSSPAMTALREQISQLIDAERRLSDRQAPAVLITGETGTGKELVARALHFDGARRSQPFVEVNCAAIPAHLVESELFGHERGAFTDARERKIGLVEAAHGGTLFLDEVGDLHPTIQVKLLKLLEDRTVRRLGSTRDRSVDLRFIAATHCPIETLVREGHFRADLYYRLNVMRLHVPALRERGDDVLELAAHFVDVHSRRYSRPGLSLGADARTLLMRYPWRGNVRELRNVMEHAVLSARGNIIDAACLSLRIEPLVPEELSKERAQAVVVAEAAPATLGEIERQTIVKALEKTGGNVTRAARVLGVTRDTLRYKLEKYKLRAAH